LLFFFFQLGTNGRSKRKKPMTMQCICIRNGYLKVVCNSHSNFFVELIWWTPLCKLSIHFECPHAQKSNQWFFYT
jgi:hypothetical protein